MQDGTWPYENNSRRFTTKNTQPWTHGDIFLSFYLQNMIITAAEPNAACHKQQQVAGICPLTQTTDAYN